MLSKNRKVRLCLYWCCISALVNVGIFLLKDYHGYYLVNRNFIIQSQSLPSSVTLDIRQNFSCRITKFAASAISRARSAACKRQLEKMACLIQEGALFPKHLPRFCPTKADHNRGDYLGCYLKDTRFHFRVFKEEDFSEEKCLSFCFTGHREIAGVQRSKLTCWCGSTLIPSNRVDDDSCSANCHDNQTGDCGKQDVVQVFSTGLPAVKSHRRDIVYNEDHIRSLNPVRIVFVFTVTGRGVRQIKRLFKAIYHVDHYYYIHVDSRRDYLYRELLKLEDSFPNVRLARDRIATIWGGASRLQAHLSIMKTLLEESGWTWDYYINLSESHYPLKNITLLAQYLRKYEGKNFIRSSGRTNPTIVTDQNFYECDEHLWLLGERELPEGIVFDRGPDWICLHRDFVNYTISDSDPLLTGLKEMYKYTMSPVESFFHVLVHNSRFCETWVDENMHVFIWNPDKGCQCDWHADDVDWCGCSPLVIRKNDFNATLVHRTKTVAFWTRKCDPMIDQTVVNYMDGLLGIQHKDKTAFNQYWQSDFHIMDQRSSRTSLITSFAYSFIRRSVQTDKCALRHLKLIETHLLNVDDKFHSYLVKFEAMRSETDTKWYTFESQFSPIRRFRKFDMEGACIKRLSRFELGTNYDPKEEIFRNYPGFFGPSDKVLTLRHAWESGPECNATVLWIDPSGKTVLREAISIEPRLITILSTLETTLRPGVWIVKLQIELKTVLELQFLTLPIADVTENTVELLNKTKTNFPALHKANHKNNDVTSDKRETVHVFSSRVDELTAKFWKAEGLCSKEDIRSECPSVDLCSKTSWSSMSPDPKSEINTDRYGNMIT